jgi:hypothetical protein
VTPSSSGAGGSNGPARKARAFDWRHEVALIDGATVTITVAHKARAAVRLAFRPMAAWSSDAGRVEGGAAGPDDDGLRHVVRCHMLARPGSDRGICKPGFGGSDVPLAAEDTLPGGAAHVRAGAPCVPNEVLQPVTFGLAPILGGSNDARDVQEEPASG